MKKKIYNSYSDIIKISQWSKFSFLTKKMKKNILFKSQKKKVKIKIEDDAFLLSDLKKNINTPVPKKLNSNVIESKRNINFSSKFIINDINKNGKRYKFFYRKWFKNISEKVLKINDTNKNIIKIPKMKKIQLKNYDEFYCDIDLDLLNQELSENVVIPTNQNSYKSNIENKINLKIIENKSTNINDKLNFYLKNLYSKVLKKNKERNELKKKLKFKDEEYKINLINAESKNSNKLKFVRNIKKPLTQCINNTDNNFIKWKLNFIDPKLSFNKNKLSKNSSLLPNHKKSIKFIKKNSKDITNSKRKNKRKSFIYVKSHWMNMIEGLINTKNIFEETNEIGYYKYYGLKNVNYKNKIKFLKSLIFKLQNDILNSKNIN